MFVGNLHILKSRGVSLLEVAVTVAILSLITSGAFSLLTQPFAAENEEETRGKLLAFKRAITGESRMITGQSRTDFGFLGDTGNLPASLEDLWILGAQPVFTYDTSVKLGAGWAGPYIQVPPLELFDDIKRDAWGTEIQYVIGTEISAGTGQTVRAKLISYGPDTSAGGGDDLTVEIYETELLSEVVGFVRDAVGNPLPGVTATLKFPFNSITSSATLQTDSAGAFTFTDVTFGNRSLVIEPNLVYVQDTAVTTGGQSNDVEFVIQNFSSSDATFTSLTLLHPDQPAFYERLRVDNSNVFTDTSDRVGSGETVVFSTQTAIGTGSIAGGTIPVRLQSPFTLTPNQDIGEAARRGGTVRIQVQDFKDAETGAAGNVDMTGITFQATFSDGSVAIFTTVRQ